MWTGFLLTNCECGSPPCQCQPFQRDTTCEHKLKGEYGKELHKCGKTGTLRKDCNTFWESKKVLCEEHYPEHYKHAHIKCGICGSNYANCVC
uniref:ORF46 n=1 Tax=Nitrosopumilaceae spindle-shaped virus TaxID=3065433 RepID=A0AAT9J9E2_9VIRU